MVKILRKIEVKNPSMLCAWPGMGNVALGAIDYVRRELRATRFAEIETKEFQAPGVILVKEGVAKLPSLPRNMFYFTKNPELIIFEGETQLTGKPGEKVMQEILDLAGKLKVKRIFTGAAFPVSLSHREESQVYGVVNEESLRKTLIEQGIEIMGGGEIAGMNGLLLGYAARRNIEGICLLATLPVYALGFSNPKASKAIVEILARMLGLKIDFTDLEVEVQQMERNFEVIEEKIKEVFPLAEKEEEETKVGVKKEKVPSHIMEKIERLFREAKVDRKKAYELKRELDRWKLFEIYEDRFLDLFKDHQ